MCMIAEKRLDKDICCRFINQDKQCCWPSDSPWRKKNRSDVQMNEID